MNLLKKKINTNQENKKARNLFLDSDWICSLTIMLRMVALSLLIILAVKLKLFLIQEVALL